MSASKCRFNPCYSHRNTFIVCNLTATFLQLPNKPRIILYSTTPPTLMNKIWKSSNGKDCCHICNIPHVSLHRQMLTVIANKLSLSLTNKPTRPRIPRKMRIELANPVYGFRKWRASHLGNPLHKFNITYCFLLLLNSSVP